MPYRNSADLLPKKEEWKEEGKRERKERGGKWLTDIKQRTQSRKNLGQKQRKLLTLTSHYKSMNLRKARFPNKVTKQQNGSFIFKNGHQKHTKEASQDPKQYYNSNKTSTTETVLLK